jgi:hypothetical protein
MLKKFINNGHDDCIYCGERERDCWCADKSAEDMGFHYERIPTPMPPIDFGPLDPCMDRFDRLAEAVRRAGINMERRNRRLGVWKKGNQWFKSHYDLVDYFNYGVDISIPK